MAVHVLALVVDLRLPAAHSLKEKRAVVKTIVEGARRRYRVAAAETGALDKWQRSELAFSAVSASATHVDEVVDELERYIWSFPEIEVVSADRRWLEAD